MEISSRLNELKDGELVYCFGIYIYGKTCKLTELFETGVTSCRIKKHNDGAVELIDTGTNNPVPFSRWYYPIRIFDNLDEAIYSRNSIIKRSLNSLDEFYEKTRQRLISKLIEK